MSEPKILPNEIRIEKLSSKHTDIIKGFKCYEKDLVDFLIEDALDNQEKRISTTHLWFLKETSELLGYVTLLTDKINLESNLKKYFRDKGILYKSLPALKIGRLAVDDTSSKRGIGSMMVRFTIQKALDINVDVGCRFITLDAKRNPDKTKDSIHFYKKLEFGVLKARIKGTTPMFKDISKIIEEITEKT